jgi:quercetin 2,3-dioxygenase
MQQIIFKANERGIKDIGWLKSNFTFSFSSYYNPSKNGFGLLKVFNDDVVQAGKGFGLHPHQNMEIVSIMLQGHMNHKDTMGYSTEIKADGVQIMSAGSGLRHEEYNIGEEEVHFLQIWIEPKLQNINPRYQQRSFPKEKRTNQITTVVSNEEGQAHCWINQNAKISLGFFAEPTTTTYTLNPTNKAVFIFAITNGVTIENIPLTAKDAIGIWDSSEINIAVEPNAEFVVIEVPINH